MSVLIYLVPVSLVLLGLAVWAFWWAVKRGQFDDLDTPAIDILAEDRKDGALKDTAEARAQAEQEPP
jgi:cbb3-type cytochrome oxidase maturation protein